MTKMHYEVRMKNYGNNKIDMYRALNYCQWECCNIATPEKLWEGQVSHSFLIWNFIDNSCNTQLDLHRLIYRSLFFSSWFLAFLSFWIIPSVTSPWRSIWDGSSFSSGLWTGDFYQSGFSWIATFMLVFSCATLQFWCYFICTSGQGILFHASYLIAATFSFRPPVLYFIVVLELC